MTVILICKFQTSDEEMKEIVLKVVKQCAVTKGVTPTHQAGYSPRLLQVILGALHGT
jgi:hypothetical protein